MAGLVAEDVRVIVREETADMRADIGTLKTDVAVLKGDVRDLGVQFEHFGDKMDAIAELVTTTVRTRREVDVLGPRVEALEDLTQVQKRVIVEHSAKLRQLQRDGQ